MDKLAPPFSSPERSNRGPRTRPIGRTGVTVLIGFVVALTGCGGGGGAGDDSTGANPPPNGTDLDPAVSCSTRNQQNWVRSYVRDNYFWDALTPDVAPDGYTELRPYFQALLFTGNETYPADRYSGYTTTEAFNRFYGEGKTMGYGVAVAGQEVLGSPDKPLYVRYVEPASPAFAAGVRRGDQVLALNGRAVRDLIAANDFSALSATTEGQTLVLSLQPASQTAGLTPFQVREVRINSAIFDLTPVQSARVLSSPAGKPMGYVYVHNMVSQTEAGLSAAFADFRSRGVQSVVLDLRYNGGGLVSVGGRLASYAAGRPADGRVYAQLVYSDKQAASNQTFRFSNPAMWEGVQTVYVLAGQRTCSASEQLISGLRGVGVNVVTVGDTTCGKPVGFLPRDYCGNTYSLVNFESLNAVGAGRYFNGLSATCRVADDVVRPLGDAAEGLLAAARTHADTGVCPPTSQADRQSSAMREGPMTLRATEPEEPGGMLGR